LRGFLRLIQIRVDDSTHITYEVTCHGQSADFFTTIAERKLNQLDFSEYNHTLSSGNIIDSWSNQIYKNGTPQAFAYGEGYMYAMIDKGHPTNIALWDTSQFTPSLYAKTVVDKIFTNAGFTYTNDSYFNNDKFKRLILPNPSSLTADASILESRRFRASRTTTAQSLDLNSILLFQNDSSGGNYDNGANYNNTTGQYTLPVGGNFVFDVDLSLNYASTGYAPIFQEDIWLVFGLYANGVLKTTATVTVDFGSPAFNVALYFQPITLLSGEVVDIRLAQVWDQANTYNLTNAQFQLDMGIGSYMENDQTSYTFGYGETVDFGVFLNSEIKQSDLLMSFIKMFNLYIEPNKDNPKQLRIVPRDEFYNGSQIDWTAKLDYSQSVEIVPMGELEANPYVFTYKEGKDDANVTYQENYQSNYGSRTYKVDNQFIKNEKKIEIAFSPTQVRSYNSQKNFVLSYMPNNQDGDLRILYYSGLVTGVNWRLWSQYAGFGLNYANRYSLPLTLHYDSITNPTFDILFGMPKEIGIGAGYKYTNSNLVNNFYYRFLSEITGSNSKLFRGYFRITPKDWLNLSFADAYFFEGQYWRLNKIEDYNPSEDGVYLCEFLLAQFIQPATIVQKTIGAGTGQGQQGETYGDTYPGGNRPFKPGIKGVTVGISQGGVRRGAGSSYYPIEGADFDEFVDMRRPQGDTNRQCLNIHHAVCISDAFMQKVMDGDVESRRRWTKVLKTRFETGEPYLFFSDAAERNRPNCYKANSLDVSMSQLCNEIYLHTDEDHTFVCCLSSMNLARWDEWKDSNAVQLAIWFLDGVMEEFIQKTKNPVVRLRWTESRTSSFSLKRHDPHSSN